VTRIQRRAFIGGVIALPPLVASGCGNGADLPAVSAHSSEENLRTYLKGRAATGKFSGAVLLAKKGKILLNEAYGMADRNRQARNTTGHRFCIGSLGKMFTAVAIAQLAGQGRLAFSDTIGRYLVGFPAQIAGRVTIHQLLTHTSGMGDAMAPTNATGSNPTLQTLAGLMQQIAKQPLLFPAGSRVSYSNSGYLVLGAIVERVARQRYNDYLHQYVFSPAGMTETDVRVYRPSQVPHMAHGYYQVGSDGKPLELTGPVDPGQASPTATALHDNAEEVQIGNPSGGAYSTTVDMLHFAEALVGYSLLSPALTKTLISGKVILPPSGPMPASTPPPGSAQAGPDRRASLPARSSAPTAGSPPTRGPVIRYGYGFEDFQLNSVRIVGHSGHTPGYEAQLDVYPDTGYISVMCSNVDGCLPASIQQTERILTNSRN
jgi:CubicO group peptidase (beta-lactamase class C family)